MTDTIIFDFGGVLIDWNPKYLYRKIFETEEQVNWFLENICRYEWNVKQDEGREIEVATQSLIEKFPEYHSEIAAYYGRWEEMLGGPIKETVEILNEIKTQNFRLLGLTNWSHQTFPIALEKYKFLSIFEGIVVSGIEKMIKPNPEIYQLITNRYNLDPSTSLFIDDSEKNIKAATDIGMKGIVFKSSQQLRTSLVEMDILNS